ncbi:cytochrome-c peroxidase [Roseivivax sp. THAF30]|uniref:cytochrome-c peroxidase n=1 Tax=Roseivivax sp. THAF30 TaxID=2587852 RepID=UPI0012678CFE|nr:cytochrome c peroxidase [Roseivivax sp. THAF30]QFT61740.1 Cytochrome c551 peroxidase precursor [Roseivivax sp. THAF30]
MRRSTILAPLLIPTALVAADLPAPVTDDDYRPVRISEAWLGQQLFYDPILSGNREVACASCHHPEFGTGDGLSLGLGDGGIGMGPKRTPNPDNMPEQRIPRNAQALWNLGAHEFRVMFHDGRVEIREDGSIRTPLGQDMVEDFASLLSAQTMFPVLSADEMAGHHQENEISTAVRQGRLTGEGGAWDLIARRVAGVEGYAQSFPAVYADIETSEDITFTRISDAIAAFIEFEWRSDQSPFDAYLRGEDALSTEAERGMTLFYGEAGCAECHSGKFQTDHGFHAMGDVQLGPGKAAAFESHARDEGRMRVTGDPADAFAFRTPSLRNVALTSPYGHAGAYDELAAYLRHHVDPRAKLESYETSAVLPALQTEDWRILSDSDERAAIAAAVHRAPAPLDEGEIAALVAFLEALTDPAAREGRLGIPASVPSGLPVPTP